jgi:hypothetical protein
MILRGRIFAAMPIALEKDVVSKRLCRGWHPFIRRLKFLVGGAINS